MVAISARSTSCRKPEISAGEKWNLYSNSPLRIRLTAAMIAIHSKLVTAGPGLRMPPIAATSATSGGSMNTGISAQAHRK